MTRGGEGVGGDVFDKPSLSLCKYTRHKTQTQHDTCPLRIIQYTITVSVQGVYDDQRKFIDWKKTKLFPFRWNWDEEKTLRGIRLQISSPSTPSPNLSPYLFRKGWQGFCGYYNCGENALERDEIIKLSFVCTKLYTVKGADSRRHSLPTGNNIMYIVIQKMCSYVESMYSYSSPPPTPTPSPLCSRRSVWPRILHTYVYVVHGGTNSVSSRRIHGPWP